MFKIIRNAQAGTIESNDVLVTVTPGEEGSGIAVELISPVANQYGRQIRQVIEQTVQECGIRDIVIHANDKGALDCTIEARVKTAIYRAVAPKEM